MALPDKAVFTGVPFNESASRKVIFVFAAASALPSGTAEMPGAIAAPPRYDLIDLNTEVAPPTIRNAQRSILAPSVCSLCSYAPLLQCEGIRSHAYTSNSVAYEFCHVTALCCHIATRWAKGLTPKIPPALLPMGGPELAGTTGKKNKGLKIKRSE